MGLDFELSPDYWMTIERFSTLLENQSQLKLGETLVSSLNETRRFIEYICLQEIGVYGLTTGFGSLRKHKIPSKMSGHLSRNLILSHDAGIGTPLPREVTLGAMVLRAFSLGKGYSGFSSESLSTLIAMINHRIIPEIPCSGSLGASGDLAFLARLGHAMMGGHVTVEYQGVKMRASEALLSAGIKKFKPQSKEGLALINGTSFMASMLSIGFTKEERLLENLIGCMGVFVNAIGASEIAFTESIQFVRNQLGQAAVAKMIAPFFSGLKSTTPPDVHNDYCIRCIPQILGPRIESIFDQRIKIERELNAVTDNPLIFKGEQISSDVDPGLLYSFNGNQWAVLSGGNFHGENLTTYADSISLANAKIAFTLERQLTYMLNSWRNKNVLPDYLIPNPNDIGLKSGFMIPHYTANALVHKIALLAQPSSLMNCTSANESEDVVSYGATACHKLLDQISLMEQLTTIYFLTAIQAYSISRMKLQSKNKEVEEIFHSIQAIMKLPITDDGAFQDNYETISLFLCSGKLRELIGFPLKRVFDHMEKKSTYTCASC